MSDVRVATRYAKSLQELAVERKALKEVYDDMRLFTKVCKENREFELMLKNPVIKHDKKNKILRQIFKDKVHPLTLAIFDIMTRKNREPVLPAVAKEFVIQYNTRMGIEVATVTTAVPLTDALRKELYEIVLKVGGRKSVELKEIINPDLIGGFILKVGDKQIDDSIQSKLKMLGHKFSQNPFIKAI
jgi:F-type H+-transporting ATPase subunit delta